MSMWTLSANKRLPEWGRPIALIGVLVTGAAESANDGITRLLRA